MASNFLKKSWSDLVGSGKTIVVRLNDRLNNNKDDGTDCDSSNMSDVSYLSSPPTSPSSLNVGLKISFKSTVSLNKRNSCNIILSNQLDKSSDSIDSTPSITIPNEKSISNFKSIETPVFQNVNQLIQYYKRLESFCLCADGKKMLIQALKQQKKDEQVAFIELVGNIANNMSADSDRVTAESLRGVCSNICEQFLQDRSKFQLNVSNRSIRKYENELDNNICPKEDYINWIDSLMMQVIFQINSETFASIKKTEEFRVWLLSKALDWVSSREQKEDKAEEMLISQFLEINDLSEYEKIFKKKKLKTLSDIKHMVDQNDFKVLGIAKLGHQKRLARLVRESFKQ